jgi:peptide/nickel transport system substrate-binding protein
MKIKIFFTLSFWKKFWNILNLKDRIIFLSSVGAVLISLLVIIIFGYFSSTEIVPQKGGILREAYLGQPINLNPILGETETDKNLIEIVFNGLLKSDGNGGFENDLAESVKVEEEGRKWIVKLKHDIYWHDGEEFNADDVVFTIKAIQNSDSRSPFKISWQGVEVKKENDWTIIFNLRDSYAFFEENLKQKIAPEHIFKDIPLSNLYLSDYNFQPVGTGPYIFENFDKSKSGFINSYNFRVNEEYFFGEPYIERIIIKFYKTQAEVIKAFNNRQVDLFSGISADGFKDIRRSFNQSYLILPRYFAVFFNENINEIFSDDNVRMAIDYATDRQELANIFNNKVQLTSSPLLKEMPGYCCRFESVFSLEEAEKILNESNWIDRDGDGIREYLIDEDESIPLSFTLISPNASNLIESASLLRKQWAKIGVRVEIKVVPFDELQEKYFKSRIYDSIIFGNVLNYQPDLFPFWHSSQKFYPGLNLSLYENNKIDILLEETRQEFDKEKREEKLSKIHEIISEDKPAIFLFNPWHNSVFSKRLNLNNQPFEKEIEEFVCEVEKECSEIITPIYFNRTNERYFNIHKWHLKTKRVLKEEN